MNKGVEFFKKEIEFYATLESKNLNYLQRKIDAINEVIDGFATLQKKIEELEMDLSEAKFKLGKKIDKKDNQIYRLEAALMIMGLRLPDFNLIHNHSLEHLLLNVENLQAIGAFGKKGLFDYAFEFFMQNHFPKQQKLIAELINTGRKITKEDMALLELSEEVFTDKARELMSQKITWKRKTNPKTTSNI
jgi:hypothetical protein